MSQRPGSRGRHAAARAGSTVRARFLGWFALFVAVAFVNFAAWSVATPLFASPDEPTQVVRAAAAVRGELVGATIGSDRNATTRVTVPAVYASGPAYTACFAFHDTVPASCARPVRASSAPVRTTTYAGRYPPLYYLVVGLPSLGSASPAGIYLMRLASALVSAVLLGLAFTSVLVWSRRRLLLAGVAVAATPMVWFLGGMVNPSGFEICAAICLWTSGVVLVTEHAEAPPAGLVAVVALSLGALVLARPLSPLWAAGTLLALALVGGWGALTSLARSRAVRWSVPPLLVCGAFALAWIAAAHSLDLLAVGVPVGRTEGAAQVLEAVAGRTGAWVEQMVGVFGALDTFAPKLTYVVWYAAVALLGALGLARGRRREGVALALLTAAVVLVPIAIADSQAHRLGIVWQGRDILPLAVGVPVLGAALAESTRVLGARVWLTASVCAAAGVAEIAAFLEALRRYAVGVRGPLDFLGGAWHPPLGAAQIAAAGCACIVVLAASSAYAASRRGALTETHHATG